MIGGQVHDIEGEGQPPTAELLEAIHRAKTGALLRASVRMGAICAGAHAGAVRRALAATASTSGSRSRSSTTSSTWSSLRKRSAKPRARMRSRQDHVSGGLRPRAFARRWRKRNCAARTNALATFRRPRALAA